MLKFKFFLKSESLENWLNYQSQIGNQCIKAFPDYYCFMFEKSNTKKFYQVEALSFMQNKQRMNYLKSQNNKGNTLINNSVSDGFYIFELSEGTKTFSRLENSLSLNPLYLKSFISNILLFICILFIQNILQLTGIISNIMFGFSIICLLLASYSLANISINMIKHKKDMMMKKEIQK